MTGRLIGAGMYGLRFDGLPRSSAVPAPVPEAWPLIELRQLAAEPDVDRGGGGGRWSVDAGHGEVRLHDGRTLRIARDPAVVQVVGPLLDPELLIHPYLTAAVGLFSRWLGREAFHGGAFVSRSGVATAVLGDRAAGKSTLLAALAGRGVPVVADDLLVVDGGAVVFAGPRTIDLRQPPTTALSGELPVGRARDETRWRVALPQIAAEHRLGGWIFLGRTDVDEIEVEPLGVRERLARLARLRAARDLPSDPAAMLDLAALPAWELRRPLAWSALDQTVASVLGLMAPAAAAR